MVNILCYKSKTLTNGENPLMIRVCKDGKKKYQSLGISINPDYWDFKKSKPKRNCPDKEKIEDLISLKVKQYSKQILDFKSEEKEFTATSLIDKVNVFQNKMTVKELLDKEYDRLRNEGRLKYASTYKELKASLLDFNKHLDIYFSAIDVDWVKRYEAWLRTKGLNDNSIGVRFRTLRTLYNKAINEKIVREEYYPFRSYKISKLHKETAKRSITKEDIHNVLSYKSDYAYESLSIDIFTFSYFMGGINFIDIARLTKENVIDGRLVYYRHKTKKLIKLPLQPKALELIKKYSKHESVYLFPILSIFHKTEQQKTNRIHKVLGKVNCCLKDIGKELNIPIKLTTFVARHSFATVLKRAGVSTSIISESLGHSSEKITQIYLDSFENEQIDAAMANLL